MRNRRGQAVRKIVDGIALVRTASTCEAHPNVWLLTGARGSKVYWWCVACSWKGNQPEVSE